MLASTSSIAAPDTQSDLTRLARRVLLSALTVFVLDGLYVVGVFSWMLGLTTPDRIFRGIAVAVLGRGALTMGWSAALGVILHFLVALGWSVVWALLLARSRALRRLTAGPAGAVVAGAGYGVFVFLAMQLIVLPLTRATPGPLLTMNSLLVLIAHVLVVGPPIVLLQRHLRRAA
jgi:hypothetical protein